MEKKLLFIFNPHSGKTTIKSKLLEIVDIFVKDGYDVTVYPTQERLDAHRKVVECAKDYSLIVCSGGDGTLNEVISGLMELDGDIPALGYIPAGSTNDYATSLNLPKGMLEAAKRSLDGEPFRCDIGNFNNKYFVYIAAFGAFTDVSYQTPQQVKNILGHQAYILEGVKRISSLKAHHMKVTYEDNVIEDDFVYGMVTNSMSVGGFKMGIDKNAILDDGLFEVALIKMPKNVIELQNIIAALILGKQETELIYTFKTGELTIESEMNVDWTFDGEFGGTYNNVLLKNEKQAITIIR